MADLQIIKDLVLAISVVLNIIFTLLHYKEIMRRLLSRFLVLEVIPLKQSGFRVARTKEDMTEGKILGDVMFSRFRVINSGAKCIVNWYTGTFENCEAKLKIDFFSDPIVYTTERLCWDRILPDAERGKLYLHEGSPREYVERIHAAYVDRGRTIAYGKENAAILNLLYTFTEDNHLYFFTEHLLQKDMPFDHEITLLLNTEGAERTYRFRLIAKRWNDVKVIPIN
jgi:hypothetical protein